MYEIIFDPKAIEFLEKSEKQLTERTMKLYKEGLRG